FTPGADHASTTWLVSEPDSSLQADYPLTGTVTDFETDDLVHNATVSLWFGDAVEGPPDASGISDVNGSVAIASVPACDTMTYKVTTDPVLAETKTTFKAHQVYSPSGAEIPGGGFTSVSSVTYQLIPTILGVAVDADKAVIAGTAFDCSRDPSLPSTDYAGRIEGLHVIVYDENGDIPQSLTVNYFVEEFPSQNQLHTSPDGLWVAANVPPGDLRVEMWGLVGGALTLLGATEVLSEAGSINIANLYTGYGDGVKFPASCMATP
ncbi:MAG: hypothetical protein H0V89_08985, partial [Deltaproteobacteria bacterium]|nr:hypothetical protein [Deltaproteobacteria bacterium]